MKTKQQNNHSTSTIETSLETIKQTLDKEHGDYTKEVIHNASGLAHDNLPGVDELSYEHHVANIRGFYARLLNSIPLRLSGALQLMLGSLDLATIDERIKKQTDQHDALEKEKNYLQSDLNKINNGNPPHAYRTYTFLLWLLGLADVISMIGAFLALLGESYIVAIILGILFGISLFLAIKAAVLLYRDKPQISNRWMRYAIPIALVVSAILLGLMRSAQVGEEATSQITPFIFIIINIVIFFATAIVVYMFFPSEQQLQQMETCTKLETEIDTKEKTIKQIDEQITGLKTAKHQLAQDRLHIRHAQKLLCDRVQAMWQESIGIFIATNIRYRTDKQYPQCFKTPLEPLVVNHDDETINHFTIEHNEK